MSEKHKIYTAMNDYMFKEIFTDKNIIAAYVNKYANLNLDPNELEEVRLEHKGSIKAKGTRFDVRIKSDKYGINLEAQNYKVYDVVDDEVVSYTEYQDNRKIHYASQIHSELYKSGDTYGKRKQTIVLFFLNYMIDGPYLQNTKLRTIELDKELDQIHIIEIALPNAIRDGKIKVEELEVLTTVEPEKYLNSNTIAKEVAKKVMALNSNEIARAEARLEEENEKDLKAMKAYSEKLGEIRGREEGIQVGREEGREEGIRTGFNEANLANARKMKELGLDIETIISVTGLTKEEIEKL